MHYTVYNQKSCYPLITNKSSIPMATDKSHVKDQKSAPRTYQTTPAFPNDFVIKYNFVYSLKTVYAVAAIIST